jgi:hypothetical protein
MPASGTALPVHTVKPSTGPKETENAPKVNGTSANSTAPGSPSLGSDKPLKKKLNKKEKEREREKKEEDKTRPSTASIPDAESSNTPLSAAAAKPLPRSNAASPAPSTSAARPTQDSELLSPTNGTDSTGGRTPITGRPPRNPNTLFLAHLPVPVTEEEVKEFFGPAQVGVGLNPLNSTPNADNIVDNEYQTTPQPLQSSATRRSLCRIWGSRSNGGRIVESCGGEKGDFLIRATFTRYNVPIAIEECGCQSFRRGGSYTAPRDG